MTEKTVTNDHDWGCIAFIALLFLSGMTAEVCRTIR